MIRGRGIATLVPSSSYTATTGNGVRLPNAGLDVSEREWFTFYLELTALTGTLNVLLDTSEDGVNWYNLGQLGPSNIAALPSLGTPAVYPDTYRLEIGPGEGSGDEQVGRLIAARYTLTTGPATFAVKMVCR